MVVKLASLKADLELEEKGDWQQALEIIPDADVWFRVSSINLPAFTIARDLLQQRWGRVYKKKPVPDHVINAEIGRLFAVHLLHEWKGFDVAYSPEIAVELLSDPANRVLIKAVEACATQIAQIEIEFVEEEAKNSVKPSERR
jgi:hypothetical protein